MVGYNYANEEELKQVAGFVQSVLLTLNMQIRTLMLEANPGLNRL